MKIDPTANIRFAEVANLIPTPTLLRLMGDIACHRPDLTSDGLNVLTRRLESKAMEVS